MSIIIWKGDEILNILSYLDRNICKQRVECAISSPLDVYSKMQENDLK